MCKAGRTARHFPHHHDDGLMGRHRATLLYFSFRPAQFRQTLRRFSLSSCCGFPAAVREWAGERAVTSWTRDPHSVLRVSSGSRRLCLLVMVQQDVKKVFMGEICTGSGKISKRLETWHSPHFPVHGIGQGKAGLLGRTNRNIFSKDLQRLGLLFWETIDILVCGWRSSKIRIGNIVFGDILVIRRHHWSITIFQSQSQSCPKWAAFLSDKSF